MYGLHGLGPRAYVSPIIAAALGFCNALPPAGPLYVLPLCNQSSDYPPNLFYHLESALERQEIVAVVPG
jgi:hypothetical protein